jgi:acyl carrier protein
MGPTRAVATRRVPEGLGRWGMYEFVEPHVRRLVAKHLGVGTEELVPDISLRDDLAADSLDLVELAMALEAEFGIVMPERVLDRVRTYGDLVHAVGLLIRTRCDEAVGGARPPARSDFRAGAALSGRVPGEMSIGSPLA